MTRLVRNGGIVLTLALLALLAVRQVGSPDAGFHLRSGQDILRDRSWPRHDTYTYSVTDRQYIDTSWGYDVVVAAIESSLGVGALAVFHAFLVVCTFALVVRTIGIAPHDRQLLAWLLLVGGLACEERFEVRPELLSYVLMAATLHLLHQYAAWVGAARQPQAAARRPPLWPLLPLFWMWANTHSLYVIGWGILGCFVAGTWLQSRRLHLRLALWSAAAIAAAFANPYGAAGVGQCLSLATRMRGDVFGASISEYSSPFETLASPQLGLYLLPTLCFFLFLPCVLFSLVRLRRLRQHAALFLALLFVPLGLAMVRNAPLFVIATLPGTVWALSSGLGGARSRLFGNRLRGSRARLVWLLQCTLVVVVLVGATRVFHDSYYVGRRRLERFGFGWNRFLLPVDAAAWIQTSGLQGRMLNHLSLGGHFVGALRQPVFADGRLEVMGERFFEEATAAFASKTALDACIARYEIGWIVFPYRDSPHTLQSLSADPQWRLVYVDHLVVIFARADAGVAPAAGVTALDRESSRPFDIGALPGLGKPRPGALRRWLAGMGQRQSYPVEAYALGVFEYLRGSWMGLARYSAVAVQQSDGAFHETYGNLGSGLLALGRLEEARPCLVIALRELPLYQREQRRVFRGFLADIDQRLSGS